MPSVDQLRNRLLRKLYELFQLDQPELDFGFYRIMHAKAEEVQEFIEDDLLNIVANEFGEISEIRKVELQAKYEEAIQIAERYGAPNPEKTEMVMKAKAKLDAAKDTVKSEADVYDHLFRFFERYYDNGDFISRRYYTRETSSKAAPFAVPYNGEEVKLHWANSDQYYTKSAEHFSNFTFDLRQMKEVRNLQHDQTNILLGVNDESAPFRVHFRVVEATEGEHSNLKASDSSKCFFILHTDNPVTLNDDNELVVNFEYRPDSEKTGQENAWRNKRNSEVVETVLERLQVMIDEGGEHRQRVAEYLRQLKVPALTEKDKNRPLLSKYVNRYTARNTMDYFIHKDLGGFLRRELDFYIKNEVMHLDDIENANFPSVESYLTKIKVLRKVAGKLIDFLAQLEDFQKKIWLKKRFVVETNYCITLDRVPEELHAEITANEAQCEEWINLFAIDEIQADLQNPGFSQPLKPEFLKANRNLVLDTRFFDESFKAKLVASIENFDEQCDGLLIHSENFQALNLLQGRYREQVKCAYIDPPYNTSATEILYKNSYKHSSWLTLVQDRVAAALGFIRRDGIVCIAIDDFEGAKLQLCLDSLMGVENRLGNIVVVHNPGGRHDDKFIATAHEYCFFYAKNIQHATTNFLPLEEKDIQSFQHWDEGGAFRTREFRRSGNNSTREARPKMFYPLLIKDGEVSLVEDEEYALLFDKFTNKFDDNHLHNIESKYESLGFDFVLPIDPKGTYRVWRWSPESLKQRSSEIIADKREDNCVIKVKDRLENKPGLKPKSAWFKSKYTAALGTKTLTAILGDSGLFSYPKSISTVEDSIRIGANSSSIVFDYFAGSGTTGHAVINLNREDGGNRKYILVEMGDYFDTVLKPRIGKVIYSENWKGGIPTAYDTGVSQCFKYLRLESYEDTLNNLRFEDNIQRKKSVAANTTLKEDYMLHYMLDVETQGSQSLLNIDAFANPTAYTLKVKKPGSDEYTTQAVDLIETFNYLIGLRVLRTFEPQTFQATFKRNTDPELPDDQCAKLVVDDDGIQQDASGTWWFRKVEGWVPKDLSNPNYGQREKVLIIWRRLNGDIEQDNLMLDEWFQYNRFESHEFEFDTIYVNGSNNISNLKSDVENWKVHLIEEEFMKSMWSGEIV